MQLSDIGLVFEGVRKTPDMYGADYIAEFCRVLDTYAVGPRRILEWGSGLSSQALAIYGKSTWNAELFLSLDTNAAYQQAVFAPFDETFIKPVCLDTIGPKRGQNDPELNYSTYPLALDQTFDLIFIDGRRRMECAFVASLISHADTIVILHDYRRSRYQPVLALFDVIEDGVQFRVMRPRIEVRASMQRGAALARAAVRSAAAGLSGSAVS